MQLFNAQPSQPEPPSASFTPSGDPVADFFDRKFHRAREISIFYEESKIWTMLLQQCSRQYGQDAEFECSHIKDLVGERKRYSDASFDVSLRPKLSPGIPADYEHDSRYKAEFLRK